MRCSRFGFAAVLATVPFLASITVCSYILWLYLFPKDSGLIVRNTTSPAALPGTVSYIISTPVKSLATTIDGTTYTIIKPSTVYTTVYLGKFKGLDTSTFGPKPGSYIISTKPILFSGKPYNFRRLSRWLRPNPTNGPLESRTT